MKIQMQSGICRNNIIIEENSLSIPQLRQEAVKFINKFVNNFY